MKISGLAEHRALPPWVWPLTVLAVALVLVRFGRYLVTGAFTAVALAFVLALVAVLVWAFVAMVLSGPRGALHGVPRSIGQARAAVRGARHAVVHVLGHAPWRKPQRVIGLVAAQVAEEVFVLPGGPVAYSHLNVRMAAESLGALDAFMPIEDVAGIWAQHYVEAQRATQRRPGPLTVTVSSGDLPRGRALVFGGFRAEPDGADTWARAHCSWNHPGGESAAGEQERVRMRRDDPTTRPPGADQTRVSDEGARRDPDATVQSAAAGPRPTAEPTVRGSGPASRPQQPAATEQTLGVQRVDPGSGHPVGRPIPINPTGAAVGRDAGMDVKIDNPFVSREHAHLRRVREQWTVTDKGSTHGTALNGTRLTPGTPYLLGDGDTLTFGRDTETGTPTYSVQLSTQAPGQVAR